MTLKISSDKWNPVGVESLETAADNVVRIQQNTIVVAGPGAGKTELLAQKACFLFQTGTCPTPYRILAISFKRDAAKNLKERVHERCGDLADRFDSFTLDAFAKSLVDRFSPALTAKWRPKPGYEVMVKAMPRVEKREWLESVSVPKDYAEVAVRSWTDEKVLTVFDQMAHGEALPYLSKGIDDILRYRGLRWWREQLDLPLEKPSLSFPMLSRLAALLLRENPKITTALRTTYRFVFLDEFQDTTASQYDLITSAFQGSSSSLTAVGDRKQRIMLWAGAMPNIFEAYEKDFVATPKHLARNYRSAPELVRMQDVIAQAIEAGISAATAIKTDSSGSCVLMEFSTPEDEASHLAEMIEQGLKEGKKARDFCILVRQRTADMIQFLKSELLARGIKLRDESQLQDILAEPIVRLLLAILCLATRLRDPEAWEVLTSEIGLLSTIERDNESSLIEKESKLLIQHARDRLVDGKAAKALLPELIEKIESTKIQSVYRQYAAGPYMKKIVDEFSKALQAAIEETSSIEEAVNDLIGINVIPAMTIHKSKGLEFSTVIFLGLEDSQWWNFTKQADEERRGFFVAFSRAIENVYFTFADVRDERWGRKQQRKSQIDDLYVILQHAGVETLNYRRKNSTF